LAVKKLSRNPAYVLRFSKDLTDTKQKGQTRWSAPIRTHKKAAPISFIWGGLLGQSLLIARLLLAFFLVFLFVFFLASHKIAPFCLF